MGRNSSFHVVKKTKPKRKKRKKKDKKKGKRKKNKEKIKEILEPEDCTIRYENEETYTDKITKKISSIKLQYTKPENTNPFDMIDETNEEETNPFAESANK